MIKRQVVYFNNLSFFVYKLEKNIDKKAKETL